MKIICLIFFSIFSSIAGADEVKNLSELALLPAYCKGTQTIRQLSKDPTPIERYVAIYGHAFKHLHHYCWALNSENHAMRMKAGDRNVKLTYSLEDYKYILGFAPQDFILLPEIYTSRARVLFVLKRDGEAVGDLFKAIELKSDYIPAYARLNEYYQRIGDKGNAIKILEQGISRTNIQNEISYFIGQLKKLGETYQGTPGSALPKDEESVNEKKLGNLNEGDKTDGKTQASLPDKKPVQATPSTENTTPNGTGQVTPEDKQLKPNPYCRFCP